MKKASYKLIFNRRKKLSATGTASVEIRVTLKRKTKYFAMPVSITPAQWNAERSEVVRHENKLRINKILSDFLQKLRTAELKCMEAGEQVSFLVFKDVFSGEDKRHGNFVDFCFSELNGSGKLNKASKAKHRVVLNRLKKFNDNISFSEVNYKFFHDFEKYIRTFVNIKGNKLSDNTIRGQLKVVLSYVNLAYRLDLINKVPQYELPKESYTREGLTAEEVLKIAAIEISTDEPNYEKVRDMFLFSCYTALRFSDIAGLAANDLQFAPEGIFLKKKISKLEKFGRSTDIPLFKIFSGKPETLLKKYVTADMAGNDLIFKSLSNQKTNIHLKRIADAIGLKRMKLTFHISRHTCLSLVGEHTGNDYLVMVLGEITNPATAQRYTRRARNSKLYDLIAGL